LVLATAAQPCILDGGVDRIEGGENMTKVSRTAAFTFAVLAALVYVGTGMAARTDKPGGRDQAPEWDGKSLLVKFANAGDAAAAVRAQGDEIEGETATHAVVVRLHAGAALEARLAAYRASGKVVFAEPNYIARATLASPTDPSFGTQWAFPKIKAVDGWGIFPGSYATTGGAVVAVVDTGIDATHPDLSGRVDTADGAGCVNTANACSNGNSSKDDNGHGTHVAGIVGASTNNGVGVAGTAFSSPIIPVKVLDASGSGSYAAIINGITWAANHGARVVSLSLGGTGYSQSLCDAVTNAIAHNVLVVAAAGNNGSSQAFYPAACPGAVGVAATDSNDGSASFSNFGAPDVFISAPGVSIYSTCVATTSNCGNSAYATMSGTSMATPFVSGLAALLFGQNTGRTPADVKTILRTSADHVGNVTYGNDPAGLCTGCWHNWYGYGRINVFRALGGTTTPAPPPVAAALSSVAVSPPSVTGGNSSTGTVTLSAGAPSGGAVVSLASSNSSAAVPSSVTVAPGATTATFSITTTTVPSATGATITATYSGVSKTASLTINAAAVAADFTLAASPATLSVGRFSTGRYSVTIGWGVGTTSPVTLTVSGLPTGTTASFGTNPTTSSSTLTIRPSWNSPRGTYRLTISGSGGGFVHSTQVTLTIT
jgi:thermitase